MNLGEVKAVLLKCSLPPNIIAFHMESLREVMAKGGLEGREARN